MIDHVFLLTFFKQINSLKTSRGKGSFILQIFVNNYHFILDDYKMQLTTLQDDFNKKESLLCDSDDELIKAKVCCENNSRVSLNFHGTYKWLIHYSNKVYLS
jgi:hypothetical protein